MPTILEPGIVVSDCAIVRRQPGSEDEPYLVHFTAGERRYTCPLYAFQPRTEMVSGDSVATPREQAAVAV